MDKKQFYETYCMRCGTQRCEGIDTEWGEGCQYRWNLDGVDAAAEIKRLNDKIMELGCKLMKCEPVVHGEWISINKGFLGNDYICSECHTQALESNNGHYDRLTGYCPFCGAKMYGDNSNE